MVYRVYVEKKPGLAHEAASLLNELQSFLGVAGLKGLRVVNDQYGTPTWSRRLAEQILAVVEAQAVGLFHASGEGWCSWYDFASEFIRLMGIDCEVRPCATSEYPSATARPANSILENAALKRAGLNRMRGWKEDLAEYVSRYRDALLREARG